MGCTEERDEEWIVGGREKEKKKKKKKLPGFIAVEIVGICWLEWKSTFYCIQLVMVDKFMSRVVKAGELMGIQSCCCCCCCFWCHLLIVQLRSRQQFRLGMKGGRKGSGEAMQVVRNGGVNTTKPRNGKEKEERAIGLSRRGVGGGGALFSSDENWIDHSYCE